MADEFRDDLKYGIINQQLNKIAAEHSFSSFREFKKHIIIDDVEITNHIELVNTDIESIKRKKEIDRVKTYTKQLIESCNDNTLCDDSVGSVYSTGFMQGVNFAFNVLKQNGLLRLPSQTV